MQSHNLSEPFLMGQDKLFQQPPSRNMEQSSCTDYYKVATLRAAAKSLITSNERLSPRRNNVLQNSMKGSIKHNHNGLQPQ